MQFRVWQTTIDREEKSEEDVQKGKKLNLKWKKE